MSYAPLGWLGGWWLGGWVIRGWTAGWLVVGRLGGWVARVDTNQGHENSQPARKTVYRYPHSEFSGRQPCSVAVALKAIGDPRSLRGSDNSHAL